MAGSRPFSSAAGFAAGSPGFAERPGWWRWHVLLGVVPLAGYLLLHLAAQLLALAAGPEQRALESAWERRPFWDVLVLVFVLLPLLAHAALGLWRVASEASVAGAATVDPHWPAPLGRLLQRVSAVVLLVFVCGHVWQLSGRRWLGELERVDYLAELYGSLSSTAIGGVPLVAIGYLLGIGAAAAHLGQGVFHAGLSSGLVREGGRLRLGQVCWLCGVSLFAVGALIVVRLATGSVLSGLPGAAPGALAP